MHNSRISSTILILLLNGWLGLVFAQDPGVTRPVIIWASDPVRPDDTVLVTGEDFGNNSAVDLGRLSDSRPGNPKAGAIPAGKGTTTLQPLQADGQSLKFVVPGKWSVGAWVCRVKSGDAVSDPVIINAPDPWWWNGDGGEAASPGGWIRIFGKSLNFGGTSRFCLRSGEGRDLVLKSCTSDCYAIKFELPVDLAPGEYDSFVHNGLGGDVTWRSAGKVEIRAKPVWKADIFNVQDFGAKPGEALLGALQKAATNGGGIVYLPRGRYPMKDKLIIPPHTVLKGEGMELVSLYWPDLEAPPPELISGSDFGVESLSIYCQNHKNVVADTAASTSMFLRKVRIRANCYFMVEEYGKEFRGHKGPASLKECGAAVLLRGRNFEITDCDIYASYYGVHILRARSGLIARNRILYGGRGYSIENVDRLIFEDNLVAGNNLMAIGNDISTFWSTYCRHIYYARNRIEQMYGADREMMTLDAGGGAYFGNVASVSGTKLTLAADPVFHDYTPKPRTNWTGAAVMILDGRGAGQYRTVTANTGREWEIDRPWTVVPDGSSRISIAPFRGRNIFVGNTFQDGGAFQLYASALDTIVAGNKGSRMEGFTVWGLNPHAWGHQPSWFCQFLDNEILEGNGYGNRSASFGTISYDESKLFDGPLVRAAIFRRDNCRNNSGFNIGGAAKDVVIEHCSVRDSESGIKIGGGGKAVLLRANKFERVKETLTGAGVTNAVNID